ncbi:MAG: ABC transporter substrate-binding protein [Actinomycetota bacterium]
MIVVADRRRLAALSFILVMLFVAAACGQRPGIAARGLLTGASGAAILPEGATVTETGEIISAEGEVIGTVEEGITDPEALEGIASGDTSTTSGGTTGGGQPGTSGGGGPGTGGGEPQEPSGATSPGVTEEVIKIGLHAPLSGAAPVPSDSVDRGKDLWFEWMEEQGTRLFGRRVEMVLKNDQYNPSTAVAVCKEMVEKDEVFALTGAAGTDQIQACARYAESVGVPYISAGVTEVQVSGFRTYFTTSMTYPDQSPLLVDFMITKLGAKEEKNGMLFFDTASFADSYDAFEAAAEDAGMPVEYKRKVPKTAGFDSAQQVVQEMSLQGIENVFILTSPYYWINVLKAANRQNYHPQWVGVGITMTFDTVITASCPDGTSAEGSKFFSPFPAYIDRDKYDPDFDRAVAELHPDKANPDDFMWLGWSGGKIIWEMLELPGKALTRDRFIYFLERARGLQNGIGPKLNFTPEDHLGASEVHVSQAQCGDRRWHTIEDFVSDF